MTSPHFHLLDSLNQLRNLLLVSLLQFVHYLLMLIFERDQLLIPLLNVYAVLLQLELKCLDLLSLHLHHLIQLLILLHQLKILIL